MMNEMKLTLLTSADLKRIAVHLEQREELQARLAQLNSQLAAIEGGAATPATVPDRPRPVVAPAKAQVRPSAGRRAKRGALKAAVLDQVKNAGRAGITVKDIAARIGAKYNRIFTWFYTTGRNVSEIKKVGPGKYGWTGASAVTPKVVVPPAPVPAPAAKPVPVTKPTPVAKRTAGKRAKPGQFKDSVIATVKAAGKAGINVKDIARKLGLDPQRIYVWFNATGKKVKSIKKVAPATYAWAA